MWLQKHSNSMKECVGEDLRFFRVLLIGSYQGCLLLQLHWEPSKALTGLCRAARLPDSPRLARRWGHGSLHTGKQAQVTAARVCEEALWPASSISC